jgi:CDP-paratose 2-epimerase
MSLRQLSRWCEERYGTHSISADERPRPSDTPWIVIDSSTARKAFDWRPSIPLPQILDAIDHHYREHPEWLEISEP